MAGRAMTPWLAGAAAIRWFGDRASIRADDNDGTGAAVAIEFAVLSGHPSITNADFVVI